MKALRLNGDYETELFTGKNGSVLINQALEFFIFFLTDRPVFSLKNYSSDYLDYVESKTGHRPVVQSKGSYENWWGLLKDIEKEKWWNSKITSTELVMQKQWCSYTKIIRSESELPIITRPSLLKDPFGMSGQKFQVTATKPEIKSYPVIIEPLLNRKHDFSQYIFPDGKVMAYQNEVDAKFQYKGSVFRGNHSLEDLSFYSQVSQAAWKTYQEQTQTIIDYFSRYPNEAGYSIDSFVFEENGELKIRPLSEINYRRTMGRTAFDLIQKYSKSDWNALLLLKPTGEPLWKKYQKHEDILVLSPGDTRYEIVLVKSQKARDLLSHP